MLRPFVRYFWVLKSSGVSRTLTFPIGCPQLIFHRRQPLFIPELGTSQHTFTVSGQVNFSTHIETVGDTDMIVAVFYPHTFTAFFQTPPSAFYNLEISGDDLDDTGLDTLKKRVIDSGDSLVCIRMIEEWLMAHYHNSAGIGRVGYAVSELLRTPSISVSELAGEVCLCKKQFERVFNSCVGMNPKEYSRIVRFQRALWRLQQGSCDYIGIACDCGYSDQSHFIREFRQMSGYTPKALTDICNPYSDLFSSPV